MQETVRNIMQELTYHTNNHNINVRWKRKTKCKGIITGSMIVYIASTNAMVNSSPFNYFSDP